MNPLKRIKVKISSWVTNNLPRFFYKYNFTADLYYLLFSRAFSREHRAVLTGKIIHLNEINRFKSNYFLLVRNTHRLEKGLLMRPKKPVFAVEYIGETVDNFVNIYKSEELAKNTQLTWFKDVLQLYFDSVELTPFLSKKKEKFLSHLNEDDHVQSCGKSVPYFRTEDKKSNISYDEFYKLVKQRRSVRWFLDKPVSRELIDQAILAANQSPSACNRQPFEYRVFDDRELVKKVVDYPMGTKGYGHCIPVMIVVVGNLDAYFDERDRHLIYVDASLANMALMLAFETLGLSSCPINWPDMEVREQKMENFLKLGKHQRPIMCLGVGYPDKEGMVAFSEKRSLESIRVYNT